MSDGKVVFDITGNLSGINSALNAATSTIARDTAKWTVLGQTAMNGLVSAAKAGFNGIRALWDNAFDYNASMQTYEGNFRTLLGSAEKAQAKMVEVKEYAAKTPFAFADLADATQTLLAFQVTSDEASLALRHLGDISLGDANKLQSLTLAFGQVSSAGKLAGQDLLQMINAGFNPLNIIAEKTGAAYADLKAVMSGEKTSEDFNLRLEAARREVEELGAGASESAIMLAKIGEDGMISADMVAAAMRIATSEGGLFFGALESASQTAKGQIATIADSWDMLTGKMTGGMFDALSQEALPKVISWLDELNAAYDENGFTGLKTAADRIFGEIGGMAFDLGAGLIAKIYNGLTGDTKTADEVKAYLSEIFGVAGDALSGVREAGLSVLEWIRDNGELVGGAATSIGVGFGVMTLLTHPLTGALGLLAGAIALLTTDWTTFEEKYPNLVAAFEAITGIEFDDFVAGVESAKTNLCAFYNDALAPLFTWLTENGADMQTLLAGIGLAMALMGAPVAGISLVAGVIITNWGDIKTAVEGAYAATVTFLMQTVPEGWNTFCTAVSTVWQENVCTPIDNAAQAVADFFGIRVPEDWSLTGEIGKAFETLKQQIEDVIQVVMDFLGIELTEGSLLDPQKSPVSSPISSHLGAGRFAGWSDDAKDQAHVYADLYNEYRRGNEAVWDEMEACLRKIARDPNASADEFVDAFDELVTRFEEGEAIELPAQWFDNTQATLQSELDGMPLSATVQGKLVLSGGFAFGPLTPNALGLRGLTGETHASGGLFTSATRFLGADGMHTFGESGTEAVLPLDTLWRKLGLTFDQAFTANLDAMQYAVMPPIPAAAPTSYDEDKLSDTIAAAVREAVSGLTVEMDKRTVGRILKPVISQEIADDVNNRRWTS